MRAPRINKSPKAGEATKQNQDNDTELDSPIAIDRETGIPTKTKPNSSLKHRFVYVRHAETCQTEEKIAVVMQAKISLP